jgi:lipid-A-disaccharide synthase
MALMGGIEVLRKYPTIRKNRNLCRNDLLNFKPDVLILVDYSGFNLPMARFAVSQGIRVIYYISPKLWAWARWRVKTIRSSVEKTFVILPFEVDFYRLHQVNAEYYGNPVLDSIDTFESQNRQEADFCEANNLERRPIVALLAGSRKQEIEHLLPEMLGAARYYPDFQFIVAGAPSIPAAFYERLIGNDPVHVVYGQTYELVRQSRAAVVTSGTATLETALLRIPEVVVYKTSAITFFIGNFFVKVKYFSLVNLILDKPVVKELLQKNLTRDIRSELDLLLFDEKYRTNMLHNYALLRNALGEPGVAERVAKRIAQILQKS